MTITRSQADDFRSAIEAMCRAAGEIQMRHFRRLAGYEKKGAIDLLTIADKESEEAIKAMIGARFPGHAILAEESGASGDAASEWRWVIDPIDGTTNFAHGMPLFSTSIALQQSGVTVAGGIFGPALGDMYLAARGHGAARNGVALSVSKVEVLDDALVVTGFPYDRRATSRVLADMVRRFLERTQGLLRLGSAALDLAHVAAGNLDAFYEAGLHPWDMAAGALMVEEAGGRMSDFDGGAFSIFGKTMLATNGRVHAEMMAVIGEAELPAAWKA